MKTKEIQAAIESALSGAFSQHDEKAGERWGDAPALRRLIARLLEAKEIAARLQD